MGKPTPKKTFKPARPLSGKKDSSALRKQERIRAIRDKIRQGSYDVDGKMDDLVDKILPDIL